MRRRKWHGQRYSALNTFVDWILPRLNRMHLYSTNGEAAFKGLGMFFTWGGTIFIYLLNEETIAQDALLFFALGIILEYMAQFISSKNKGKIEQLLPGILIIANIFVYFFAFIQIGAKIKNANISEWIYKYQIFASCITIGIIFIDMLLKICLKDPVQEQSHNMPENNLKNI